MDTFYTSNNGNLLGIIKILAKLDGALKEQLIGIINNQIYIHYCGKKIQNMLMTFLEVKANIYFSAVLYCTFDMILLKLDFVDIEDDTNVLVCFIAYNQSFFNLCLSQLKFEHNRCCENITLFGPIQRLLIIFFISSKQWDVMAKHIIDLSSKKVYEILWESRYDALMELAEETGESVSVSEARSTVHRWWLFIWPNISKGNSMSAWDKANFCSSSLSRKNGMFDYEVAYEASTDAERLFQKNILNLMVDAVESSLITHFQHHSKFNSTWSFTMKTIFPNKLHEDSTNLKVTLSDGNKCNVPGN
ncbi:hypothetical protein PR048_000883 [Dryococelus australis]|uniref:Uncharacterized protein n=1 Tax=Dryococelus australis TaxID=614101 RepID=A0ABQ9IFV0_9NEOP|nr:hypothetical protein PR048_000883 [Dryococelus australis]